MNHSPLDSDDTMWCDKFATICTRIGIDGAAQIIVSIILTVISFVTCNQERSLLLIWNVFTLTFPNFVDCIVILFKMPKGAIHKNFKQFAWVIAIMLSVILIFTCVIYGIFINQNDDSEKFQMCTWAYWVIKYSLFLNPICCFVKYYIVYIINENK